MQWSLVKRNKRVQVDFAQPAKRDGQQLSLLVSNPLTVLVDGNEMTVEKDKLAFLSHREWVSTKTTLSPWGNFVFNTKARFARKIESIFPSDDRGGPEGRRTFPLIIFTKFFLENLYSPSRNIHKIFFLPPGGGNFRVPVLYVHLTYD